MSGHAAILRRIVSANGLYLASAVFLVALGLLSWQAFRSRVQTSPEPPPLRVNPAHLNLGEIVGVGRIRAQIPIENLGQRSLKIDGIEASCSCIAIRPASVVLAPGTREAITLEIDFSTLRPTSGRFAFEYYLLPRVAGYSSPEPWALEGAISPPCSVNSLAVHYLGADSIVAGCVPPPAKRIRGNLARNDYSLSIAGDESLQVALERDGQAKEFDLCVPPPGDLTETGSFARRFTLLVHSESQLLQQIPIDVLGSVLPPCVVHPAALHLGVQTQGKTVRREVTIDLGGGKILDVSGDSVATQVSCEQQDGAATLHVALTITEQTKHVLTVIFEQPSGEVVPFAIPIYLYPRVITEIDATAQP